MSDDPALMGRLRTGERSEAPRDRDRRSVGCAMAGMSKGRPKATRKVFSHFEALGDIERRGPVKLPLTEAAA